MTSVVTDTAGALTRARMSQLVALKKGRRVAPPVTLTCPKCGRAVILEVLGTAHCLPCRRAMQPAPGGGDRALERAQHATNPQPARLKQGSRAAVRRRREWHAHQ